MGAKGSGSEDSAYLFYYFEGHAGEKGGLYAAYSHDLVAWHKLGEKLLTPAIGEWGVFRDPSVVRDGAGVFHLAWTTGKSGFGYARSVDGLHWGEPRFIVVADSARGLAFANVWAPDLVRLGDTIHCVWSSTLMADYIPPPDPAKWWEARWVHRFYYTSTTDFETFTPTAKFWDPGFNAIDAAFLQDGQSHYIFFKDERKESKHVVMGKASSFWGPYGELTPVTTRSHEGAAPVKRGDTLYLYYDWYAGYNGYRFKTSADMKTFSEEQEPRKVDFSDVMRHGCIVTITKEELAGVLSAAGR